MISSRRKLKIKANKSPNSSSTGLYLRYNSFIVGFILRNWIVFLINSVDIKNPYKFENIGKEKVPGDFEKRPSTK